MGWTRAISQEEKKNGSESIVGFMTFCEGACVEGTLHAIVIKPDGRGFFLVRLTKQCIVNLRDGNSKTGQGLAYPNQLVGIRKVKSTAVLAELKLGTLIVVNYIEQSENTAGGKTYLFHHLTVDIFDNTNGEIV